MALRYRQEIDGLRAVSVMAVLLFRAGISFVPGGFVGVDVFFVISGYLITEILIRELIATEQINFKRFYLRRIRRLGPALLSTILLSGVAAVLLFSRQQMNDFAMSVLAAIGSVSNIFFWLQADYFDAASNTKPLLHTWSLSAEEQFYLVWPILMIGLYKTVGRKGVGLGLGILAIGSLLFAEFQINRDISGAYYLLPSRVIEFAFGAGLVWIKLPASRPALVDDCLAFLGLVLVLFAAITYSEEMRFPGLSAVVPCLGASLVIIANNSRWSRLLLTNSPMVYIGKISYSLYLVHWPIIVFFYSYTFSNPTLAQQLLIIVSSILLGGLQYRFVETPFRTIKTSTENRRFLFGSGLIVVAFCGVVYFIIDSDGWSNRIARERLQRPKENVRSEITENYCIRTNAELDTNLITCQNFRGGNQDIFIWGDSHARHLVSGFSEVFSNANIYVLYKSACPFQSGFGGYVRDYGDNRTEECVARNEEALEFFRNLAPTNIILTSAKRGHPENMAKINVKLRNKLQEFGHNVNIVGDVIRPGKDLTTCFEAPSWLVSSRQLEARCVGDAAIIQKERKYNNILKEADPQTVVVDDEYCDNLHCATSDGETLYFRDHHHLGVEGSVFYVSLLRPYLN